MKTIALVDPWSEGHHPTYLKLFSRAVLKLGHRVIVFCAEPRPLREMLARESGTDLTRWSAVEYARAAEGTSSRRAARQEGLEWLIQTRRALEREEGASGQHIDLVFFCWLDDFLNRWLFGFDVDRLLGRPFSGLYFQPWHMRLPMRHARWRRGPFKPDDMLTSRHCRAVAVLDVGIAEELGRRLEKPVVAFPDITDERQSQTATQLETAIRTRARGRPVVGLLGSLEKRKGLWTIIEQSLALTGQPVFFLVAGVYESSTFSAQENQVVLDWMENPPENVFALSGYIEDEAMFNSLVRACDLLYCVYHNFPYSSNLLTKGACFRVPVIVSRRYLMGERVRQFNLGFAVDEDMSDDFRAMLKSGMAFAAREDPEFERGCQRYMEQHGFPRLVSAWQQILQACGLS